MSTSQPQPPQVTFSSFLPVVMLSIAFAFILVWMLILNVRDYAAATNLRDRLVTAQAQAVGVEEKMKALMMDLITLSEADPDAKAIIEKYQVRFNAPAGRPQTASPDTSGSLPLGTKRSPLPSVTSAVAEAKAP